MHLFFNYNFTFIKYIRCFFFCFITVQKLTNPFISSGDFKKNGNSFYCQSSNSAQPHFVIDEGFEIVKIICKWNHSYNLNTILFYLTDCQMR